MPFTGLFQKRSSQKNKKGVILSKENNGENITESESTPSSQNGDSVVNELLQELITKTVNMELSSNETVVKVSSNSPVSDSTKMDKHYVSNCKNNYVETNDGESISKQDTNSKLPKQERSVSESHFEVSTSIQSKAQRKFGSEGNVLAVEEKLIPHKQRKEIDDAIGKYVEKLIRASIVKAVKNVDVNNLYQEILKDHSNSRSSESADSVEDFVVEQRLSSHSISELVELESGDELSCGNEDAVSQNRHDKLDEPECIPNEFEDVDPESFKGYLADYEDTTSVDDLKSFDEDSSVCSMSDGFKNQVCINNENYSNSLNGQEDISQTNGNEITAKNRDVSSLKNNSIANESEQSHETQSNCQQDCKAILVNSTSEEGKIFPSEQSAEKQTKETGDELYSTESSGKQEKKSPDVQNYTEQEPKSPSIVEHSEHKLESQSAEESKKQNQEQLSTDQKNPSLGENNDLIVISPSNDYLMADSTKFSESGNPSPATDDSLPHQQNPEDEGRKVNWKAGYLHVKLPQKSRGKTHVKAWKKRCVAIQPDEFVNDPKNPSLVVSVYGAESRKHKATFWQTVSSQRAVVYRSSSRTHRYAFTVSDEGRAIIHLSADSETATQEWMAAIRAVLWPPSPFMQLEKMLNGREFEISLIDNEFSYHAGLLGMYGYLTITPRKLILLHPQQGYVIQEWYLNTVDKFQLVPQPKVEDSHKVLAMTTCSDSSTGRGEMLLYCSEAVTLLQSLASTIHQVLSLRSKQDGGGNKYQKEMEEMAEWLVAPPQDSLDIDAKSEEHYKVPTRQVKSLLDIPNFIFEKSLSPAASAIYPAPSGDVLESLDTAKAKPTSTSHDSGISTCHSGDDFLNCSVTSFVVGGGPMTGKSSDSEMSDTFTPPRSPEVVKKVISEMKLEEHLSVPKA